jgi:hypothetical protein
MTLLDLLRRKKPLTIDDIPWLVKDFDVLYSAAEAAVFQAHLDGYRTAHLRDLARQLERLKPAMEQIAAVKTALRETR